MNNQSTKISWEISLRRKDDNEPGCDSRRRTKDREPQGLQPCPKTANVKSLNHKNGTRDHTQTRGRVVEVGWVGDGKSVSLGIDLSPCD